jgi:carboxylesterase type B
MNSDRHFWHGIYRTIQSRKKFATGKTFVFRFDVDGELNMFKALKQSDMYRGACHADDLFYMFTTEYHKPPLRDSKEFATIDRLTGMFASFAVTGDPNCQEASHDAIKPFDGSTPMKCLNITLDGLTEIPLPEEENMKVWNSLFEAHNVELI